MENIKSDMADVSAIMKQRDSFCNSFKIEEERITEKLFHLIERLEGKCDELSPMEEINSVLDNPVQSRNGFLGFIKMHQESREKIISRLAGVVSMLDDLI